MNGFHFAQRGNHLASLPRPPKLAISAGLVVFSLAVIGLAWLVGGPRRSGQSRAIQATLTDSPSWDRVRPAWPKYMPESIAAGPVSAAPGVATVTPAVLFGPGEPIAAPPSIAGGPELFAATIQPVPPVTTQSPPFAQTIPPQLLVPHPAAPVLMPAAAPVPGRLPVSQPMRSEVLEKIRHGFELANRGAYFAARAEFTGALRLTAQGLDDQRNTTLHSQALSAALTALKEAQDFIPPGAKLEAELDLSPIVASHRTPVLKNAPPEQLQAMRALKQYFTFAQEQFALAAGQEVSGSVALSALGKLHAALAGKPNPEIVSPAAKAIVFFQAAILACPHNYMAANDLGVLLAHNGDYAGACRVLEHSVLVNRCSENLNNLSVVYRQVGQQRLAELAAEKARVAKAAEMARQKTANLSAGGTVEWVDPAALVQSPAQWTDPPARPAATPGQQDPQTASLTAAKSNAGLAPAAPATMR